MKRPFCRNLLGSSRSRYVLLTPLFPCCDGCLQTCTTRLIQGCLQESASASKQAAVESDEEARRRRRELAVKALKKSLALAGERGESRGSTVAVEQARLPSSSEATQDAVGSSRQAVAPQVFQKEQSSGAAQAPVAEATTAGRGVTRCAICLDVLLQSFFMPFSDICA